MPEKSTLPAAERGSQGSYQERCAEFPPAGPDFDFPGHEGNSAVPQILLALQSLKVEIEPVESDRGQYPSGQARSGGVESLPGTDGPSKDPSGSLIYQHNERFV